jgi:hypothetical protein
VDLIFPDIPHCHQRPWEPMPQTLSGIDAHFWDWMLWLRSKEARGDRHSWNPNDGVHEHLLAPLGGPQPPSSIAEAVENYLSLREQAERRFGCTVPRTLQAAVLPGVRAE